MYVYIYTCAQAPLWKKKAAPVRQRRIYKTAEEVLEEAAGEAGGGGPTAAAKLASQPILDLRGPQARLVTDLEQLNATAGVCAGVLVYCHGRTKQNTCLCHLAGNRQVAWFLRGVSDRYPDSDRQLYPASTACCWHLCNPCLQTPCQHPLPSSSITCIVCLCRRWWSSSGRGPPHA